MDNKRKDVRNVKNMLRKKALFLRRRKADLKQQCRDRGVVYLSHVPHGFYEKEMKKFFGQFGDVTAVKLPRSTKGGSKGYAFVEFEHKEVAKIAADAMNNYLMFDRLLQAKYIPPEKQKPVAFYRKEIMKFSCPQLAARKRRTIDRTNKNKLVQDENEFTKKVASKVKGLHKKLFKKTGVDYEFQVDDRVELLEMKTGKEESGALQVSEMEESDDDIRLRKPPTAASRLLRTSKSKLGAAKTKTLKVVNTKVAKAKKKASKVVKENVDKLKKKVTEDKPKVKKISSGKVGKKSKVKNVNEIPQSKIGKVAKAVINEIEKGNIKEIAKLKIDQLKSKVQKAQPGKVVKSTRNSRLMKGNK